MVAELLYLEKQGNALPIEMMINSSGTTRQDGEIVSRGQYSDMANIQIRLALGTNGLCITTTVAVEPWAQLVQITICTVEGCTDSTMHCVPSTKDHGVYLT